MVCLITWESGLLLLLHGLGLQRLLPGDYLSNPSLYILPGGPPHWFSQCK